MSSAIHSSTTLLLAIRLSGAKVLAVAKAVFRMASLNARFLAKNIPPWLISAWPCAVIMRSEARISGLGEKVFRTQLWIKSKLHKINKGMGFMVNAASGKQIVSEANN